MKPFTDFLKQCAMLFAAIFCMIAYGTIAVGQDDLDQQLLKSLESGEQQDSPVTVVNRLLDNTETARERLEAGQLDQQTSSIQQQILDDIDALLAASANSPPPANPPPGSSQSQQQGSASESQSARQQGEAAGQTSENGQQMAPTIDPNATARESNERTLPGEETAAQRERRLGLATAAWGHLPPKVREQMRSAFSETYLPEYDELVRLYYEALAARRESRDEPVNRSSP